MVTFVVIGGSLVAVTSLVASLTNVRPALWQFVAADPLTFQGVSFSPILSYSPLLPFHSWAGPATVPEAQRQLTPEELVPYLSLPSPEAVESACELLGKILNGISPARLQQQHQVS